MRVGEGVRVAGQVVFGIVQLSSYPVINNTQPIVDNHPSQSQAKAKGLQGCSMWNKA